VIVGGTLEGKTTVDGLGVDAGGVAWHAAATTATTTARTMDLIE